MISLTATISRPDEIFGTDIVRLLVEEVIVNTKTEEVTVRHIMPLDQQFPLCTGGRTPPSWARGGKINRR
jgi:hypothetical protein